MNREQWGTLSIYDHRSHLLVQSLVFFDRLVIPVPRKPIYDLSAEEIERLAVDVAFLERNEAAKAYPWDSSEFQEWEVENARELLAVGTRDKLYDTRLMLKERVPDDVIATPVYGARSGYDSFSSKIHMDPKQHLTLELAQHLTIPAQGVPLADLIELRNRPSFRNCIMALRKWRVSTLPDLMSSGGSGAEAAASDLDRMMKRYEEELHSSRFKKMRACVVSILALGAALASAPATVAGVLTVLAAAAPSAFAIQDVLKPFWKEIRDREFAVAGVIYEAQNVFEQYGGHI